MSVAVYQMFQSIAHRYDFANDVLSFGFHRAWRKQAIEFGNIKKGERVLDLCTGTGDFAFDISQVVGPTATVEAIDFVEKMISHAKEKQTDKPQYGNINFAHGDAMRIPFADNSFDAVTISFGIRNVDDPAGCLREICRVLKPSGRAIVLEFGQPTLLGFKQLYQIYCKAIMPFIGGVITGNKSAYQYLPETSQAFPAGEKFLNLMKTAQYKELKQKPLFAGIAFIYCGTKS